MRDADEEEEEDDTGSSSSEVFYHSLLVDHHVQEVEDDALPDPFLVAAVAVIGATIRINNEARVQNETIRVNHDALVTAMIRVFTFGPAPVVGPRWER